MSSNYEGLAGLAQERTKDYRREAEDHRLVKESRRDELGTEPDRMRLLHKLLALLLQRRRRKPENTLGAARPRTSG